MNQRRWFTPLVVALLVLTLAACGSLPAGTDNAKGTSDTAAPVGSATNGQTAKVGLIAYLTGNGAAYGEAIMSGIKLAQEELNEKNKGALQIELAVEDSVGKRDQALNAAQKLINSEKVVAIIGPTTSSEMFVVGPVANRSGVPILGTSTVAEGIPEIGEYVFRNALPESLAVPAAIKKAVEKIPIKKVAIIYAYDDDFTKSGFETMKATAEELGLEIVRVEKYASGDSDFSAQLTNIQAAKPDAIFASCFYKEGGLILDQARKLGLNLPVVGGDGFNSPQIIAQAGKASEGVIVASPWFPELDEPMVQAFVQNFETRYGKKPDQFAASAYDGLYILSQALLNSGAADDRAKMRDALAAIKDFNGVTGKLSFDEVGNPIMNPVVLTIRDGKFVELK
ncbi:ABC transporter substrate-binding protein [Brevibacillus sp. NRS-1366]|uniref:ABC transporter substrate-binding protein n=1 Tax=Brevibacillus sp. NRS-1366 TaxID=3233899 RepID=UPI003D1CDBAD